jgi:hypothetical protein
VCYFTLQSIFSQRERERERERERGRERERALGTRIHNADNRCCRYVCIAGIAGIAGIEGASRRCSVRMPYTQEKPFYNMRTDSFYSRHEQPVDTLLAGVEQKENTFFNKN